MQTVSQFKNNFMMNSLAGVIALGFFSNPLQANVSLKNGNFFIGYTDIVYPGGFEPKIERVYNSKTDFHGIFGYGWGNEYEVFMSVAADGSVIVHEYGGGAENRFSPVAFNAGDLDRAVDQIAETSRKIGAISSNEQLSAYKKHLKSDADFRNKEWESLRRQGKIQARTLAVGTQLNSNRFSYQYITKVQGGYVRTFDSGRIEKFDESGKLVRIQDKNNNFIEFSYNKDSHLQKLTDNFNRKMFFSFNNQGLLEKIEGESGKVAEYKYSSAGDLLQSKDVDGNVFTFKYDGRRHNLQEIGYSDKTTMAIAYYPMAQHENVKSVKSQDGTLTEYAYLNDTSDKGHFLVDVKVKAQDGKQVSSSKYEYFMKTKVDGEEWQYRLNTTLDGERTETTYNECCGLPLLIKSGSEETSFQYDTKGHVTKKITPSEVTELSYEPKVGKVSKVVRYPKSNSKQIHWSTFQYDDKGNLLFAKNSEGKGVRLFYDNNGRISVMIDQSKRQIKFKYNENSKPIEISDPALGTITVSYTNSGEIKKVESSAGRKIALQVTSAFQNLLDIIRPAGVSLSL